LRGWHGDDRRTRFSDLCGSGGLSFFRRRHGARRVHADARIGPSGDRSQFHQPERGALEHESERLQPKRRALGHRHTECVESKRHAVDIRPAGLGSVATERPSPSGHAAQANGTAPHPCDEPAGREGAGTRGRPPAIRSAPFPATGNGPQDQTTGAKHHGKRVPGLLRARQALRLHVKGAGNQAEQNVGPRSGT
jgi:hypothetical protein